MEDYLIGTLLRRVGNNFNYRFFVPVLPERVLPKLFLTTLWEPERLDVFLMFRTRTGSSFNRDET